MSKILLQPWRECHLSWTLTVHVLALPVQLQKWYVLHLYTFCKYCLFITGNISSKIVANYLTVSSFVSVVSTHILYCKYCIWYKLFFPFQHAVVQKLCFNSLKTTCRNYNLTNIWHSIVRLCLLRNAFQQRIPNTISNNWLTLFPGHRFPLATRGCRSAKPVSKDSTEQECPCSHRT